MPTCTQHVAPQGANLAISPKTFETGIVRSVHVVPIWIILANYTHCRKIDDFQSETVSILTNLVTFAYTQLTYIRFSLMNMQQNSMTVPNARLILFPGGKKSVPFSPLEWCLHVDIFTRQSAWTTCEISLCGHETMRLALIPWELAGLAPDTPMGNRCFPFNVYMMGCVLMVIKTQCTSAVSLSSTWMP